MQSASLIDLSTEELAVALNAAAEFRDKNAARRRLQDLVAYGSESEIISEAANQVGDAPVTLANRYCGPGYILPYQEIWFYDVGSHPRRPVIMSGAREVRVARNAWSSSRSPNGWAFKLFERAVRRAKITALSLDEFDEKTAPILKAIRARYYTSYQFDRNIAKPAAYGPFSRFYSDEKTLAYVGGKQAWLSLSERSNIRALRRIIEKTDKLDKRLELARAHFRERMAA